MHISTKTYGHEVGLSACFRQWRAESHCSKLHGYALAFRFEFEAQELDQNNWVIDFGALKTLKGRLEDLFDHRLLVARDDPDLERLKYLGRCEIADVVVVDAVGCEAFAKLGYDLAWTWLHDNGHTPRVRLRSVEVKEHGANSAIFIPNETPV